ncbi:MAG: hypothetical protein Q9195_003768 [Heterodermia aff. obscurata]
MGNQLSQLSQVFPPKPTFTERNLPDQSGKTFIITGGSSGVGEQLAYILYKHNAKIYIAARSEEKSRKAIERVKARVPHSDGQMIYLHLDLNDLTTIKLSADEFLNENDRLDVLWNNAGVMTPPQGSKTKQGYELQLGTNNVAPFLFTKFLRPILAETAKKASADSVRVVWVSSNGSEVFSENGGVDLSNMDYKTDKYSYVKYGNSKAGNIYHSSELARRAASEGIISVSLNPGALKTELLRHRVGWQQLFGNWLFYDPIYGAYTELFAGLSPEITSAQNGAYIIPWGRFAPRLRQDLVLGQKTEEEGGTGIAARFWEWSEQQIEPYLSG